MFRISQLVLAASLFAAADLGFALDLSAPVPPGGRPNPYGLSPEEFEASRRNGLLQALTWPDVDYGLTLPYPALDRSVRLVNTLPAAKLLLEAIGLARFGTTWEEMYAGLGLSPYPAREGEGAYLVPFPDGRRPSYPVGASIRRNAKGVQVWTVACAACHSRYLFGRHVIGLPSLSAEATTLLNFGKSFQYVPSWVLWAMAAGDSRDYQALLATRENFKYTDNRAPLSLTTDTAISATMLSLALRELDEYATKTQASRTNPRLSPFHTLPHDSKPGTWWVVKYKNRFRLDGSITGNPIISNFVAADLAHGVDVRNLEVWFEEHEQEVRDLTTAVFGAQAPRWTDYFPAETIDLSSAKRGQALFETYCSRCHGSYDKGWDAPDAATRTPEQLLETTLVTYFPETPVIDVGTDPGLYRSSEIAAEEFNRIKIFKDRGVRMDGTGGYVPPPLEGIWARWPYFHNASAPTLCAVLTRGQDRPVRFYVQAAENLERDYDADCVGFPLAEKVDRRWKEARRLHDTTQPGLSRFGHDEGIFLRGGQELLSPEDKRDLIMFLKTL